MIAWSIEAAQKAGCFDRIIVSTDDAEVAEIARKFDAEVPFVRPDELADDHATTAAVITHALDWLKEQGTTVAALCCLYATAPFVRAEDIRTGADALVTADFAIPVTSYAFPIQRAVRRDGVGLAMFNPDHYTTRSQDLEEAYHDAGQFYWGKAEAWRSGQPPFGPTTTPIILPRWRVQDIDTEEDWSRAELLAEAMASR